MTPAELKSYAAGLAAGKLSAEEELELLRDAIGQLETAAAITIHDQRDAPFQPWGTPIVPHVIEPHRAPATTPEITWRAGHAPWTWIST